MAISAKEGALPVRSEQQLLFCCAHPFPSDGQLAQIDRRLSRDIDWSYLLAQARAHGLVPLLHHIIGRHFAGQAPAEMLAQWRRHFDYVVRRNLFLTGEAVQALKLLQDNDIAAVPFKGAVLADVYYGSLALREFADIDILLRQEDLLPAGQLLQEQGFVRRPHVDQARQFFREKGSLIIELHRNAIGFGSPWLRHFPKRKLPFRFEDLAPGLETVSLSGTLVHNIDPEALLLLLCVHGAKHRWARLSWLGDIAAVVNGKPDLSWRRLINQAADLKLQRMLFLGLCLIQDLFDVSLPADVTDQILADKAVHRLAQTVVRWLFVEPGPVQKYVERPFFYRRLWEDPRDRLPLYAYHLWAYGEIAYASIFKQSTE